MAIAHAHEDAARKAFDLFVRNVKKQMNEGTLELHSFEADHGVIEFTSEHGPAYRRFMPSGETTMTLHFRRKENSMSVDLNTIAIAITEAQKGGKPKFRTPIGQQKEAMKQVLMRIAALQDTDPKAFKRIMKKYQKLAAKELLL